MADHIAPIRERTIKQQSRYGFRWNQILRDRATLLKEVDRLRFEITERRIRGRAVERQNVALKLQLASCPLCMQELAKQRKSAT